MEEVSDRPGALKLANLVLDAGRRGSKLTHSLLSFSRKQHLAPKAVPIRSILDSVGRMLRRTLASNVHLEIRIEEEAPAPFADTAQLEAALINLALNARDAMPKGGNLVIEVRRGATTDVAPDGIQPEAAVMLAVSDTGTGMLPEVAARACEPFFTTKGVGQGSGLGLSMVHGFVQQSGGAIALSSKPGRGTRIELWLPSADGEAPLGEEVSSTARGIGRVLLVDDALDVLSVTAELLEKAGFVVTQARNGEEALHLLGTRKFDILVTDYMMPDISGNDLIRRGCELFPDLLAVILTGYEESEIIGGLPPNVSLVRKPVAGRALTQHVLGVLNAATEP